jgi:hypothetical protein
MQTSWMEILRSLEIYGRESIARYPANRCPIHCPILPTDALSTALVCQPMPYPLPYPANRRPIHCPILPTDALSTANRRPTHPTAGLSVGTESKHPRQAVEQTDGKPRRSLVLFPRYHARALEGVAKSQFPLKAVVFKSSHPWISVVSKYFSPSSTLAWYLHTLRSFRSFRFFELPKP